MTILWWRRHQHHTQPGDVSDTGHFVDVIPAPPPAHHCNLEDLYKKVSEPDTTWECDEELPGGGHCGQIWIYTHGLRWAMVEKQRKKKET